jgi:chromosome segregation protein
MTLRWRKLSDGAEAGLQDLSKRETGLQESIAQQRAVEAFLEQLHEEQSQASEGFNEVQGELYGVASQIARLEQTIQHARELQERQKAEFQETETALHDLEKHMVLDRAQVEELTQALAGVEPALGTAREEEDSAIAALAEADGSVTDWQKQFEQHHLQNTDWDGKPAQWTQRACRRNWINCPGNRKKWPARSGRNRDCWTGCARLWQKHSRT